MIEPVVVADVSAGRLRTPDQPVYDRPFELAELYANPVTGAEHDVVGYRSGTKARWHRHRAANRMTVVSGELTPNGSLIGPGGCDHLPGGMAVLHEPAGDEDGTSMLIFDGLFDVELADPTDGLSWSPQ